MKKNKGKRGRGRPSKQKYFSPSELIHKAESNLRKSQERLGTLDYVMIEEGLETILDDNKLKRCTTAELKELRRMAERLWDRFQIEKEYESDQTGEVGYGIYRESVEEMMSEEKWYEEHEFLKPKRKNAKLVHNIYSLPEHKRTERGLASKPVRMDSDGKSTETQIEEAMMVESISRSLPKESRILKGRRVKPRDKMNPDISRLKTLWT